MAGTSSYAEAARKRIGQHLVKEMGYSKRTPKKYYRQGEDILSYVYLERGHLTHVEIGVTPLYLPDAPFILNGIRLQNCALSEDCSPVQADLWAESVIRTLTQGPLAFMESIASPEALLHYLLSQPASDHRFTTNPVQTDKLIIFTSAYLGDIPSAVQHTRRTIQKIRETRIDTLPEKIAPIDAEIARLKDLLEKTGPKDSAVFDRLINDLEREKDVIEFDAKVNAPDTIRMYEQWIAPFSEPGFDRESYFLQIIHQNREILKYEKLFKSKARPGK